MQNAIKANFDANAQEKSDEFDIIITTEVLAEGVNLHRSNVIVNYDTPWNSTRLMQRIGRVNRIGSKEDFIHVFNFMPTSQGNAQIGLVQKAHAKLQAFHAMFGEDSKIFSDAEEVTSYGHDPQALRNLVNGEESVYEKYIAELKKLKADNPTEYARVESLPIPLYSAKKSETNDTVCVVRTQEGKGLYLCVTDTVRDIPTIEMIEKLQCTPDTLPQKLAANVASDYARAIEEYKIFFDKMTTAQDSKGLCTKALGIIANLRKQTLSDDSKQLLKTADRILRKGNLSLARKIIALNNQIDNKEQLFAVEKSDFDAIISREFAALKLRVDGKIKGEPMITLAITNKR
jgi:hypothetical protein